MTRLDTIKLSNARIAWRAAQDIQDGAYVNLGIGFPEMVAQFTVPGRTPIFHTENGILGFGPVPAPGTEDWDLINAGKKAVTLTPGAAFFHHADSFAMVRGGHLDVAILGAFQVAQNGDLANWSTGKSSIPAVGGAMDLVQSAKRVAVITDHTTKTGEPKLVDRCTMPLTGVGCVTRVYSSLAVIDIDQGRFVLREKLAALSFDDIPESDAVVGNLENDAQPYPVLFLKTHHPPVCLIAAGRAFAAQQGILIGNLLHLSGRCQFQACR